MNTLFILLTVVSFIAVIVFACLTIVNFLKDKKKGMKMLKRFGISFGVMILSLILFGVTLDEDETSTEKSEASDSEKKETAEEKQAKEAKIAEEKAADELKAKEKAEEKAKIEAELKAKEEADAKAKAEADAKAALEKKANAKTIDYAQLKKNPDRYAGEYVKYTGEVVQILEGDNITNIRLSVTKESYGYSINNLVFIEYPGYTDFVDGDIVTIYGEVYGSYKYKSQAGYEISLPGILADEVISAQ